MKHLTDDQILHLAEKMLAKTQLTDEEGSLLAHCAFCSDCYEKFLATTALVQVTDDISCAVDAPVPADTHSAVIEVVILDTHAIMTQLYAANAEMEFYAPLPSTTRGRSNTAPQNVQLENNESHIIYDAATKTLYITLCQTDGTIPHAYLQHGDQLEPISFTEYDGLFCARFEGLEEGEYQILID